MSIIDIINEVAQGGGLPTGTTTNFGQGATVTPSNPSPTISVPRSVGSNSQPTLSQQAAQLASAAELLDSFGSGSSGGGGSSSTTSSSTSSRSVSSVANEAEIRAAFESQVAAQSQAHDNSIGGLRDALSSAIESLDRLRDEQIAGIDEQEDLATDNAERQVDEGNEVIDSELATLLASLATAEQAIAGEAAATDQANAQVATEAQDIINANQALLARAGGGDELAAATQESIARSTALRQIDQQLGRRLLQASQGDINRREAGANAVAGRARVDLSSNMALVVAQLAAAAAQQRNNVNVQAARSEFDVEQSYTQQIINAQLQRDLTAAQRYIPEPVRVTTSSSSTTSTTSSSGGGGGSSLSPSQQIQQSAAADAYSALLNPSTPSAQSQLAEREATIALSALNRGDFATYGNFR